MISGTTKERLEYAKYVRETANYVEDILLPLRRGCGTIFRYYHMQSFKRELTPCEIAVTNLSSFTAIQINN